MAPHKDTQTAQDFLLSILAGKCRHVMHVKDYGWVADAVASQTGVSTADTQGWVRAYCNSPGHTGWTCSPARNNEHSSLDGGT